MSVRSIALWALILFIGVCSPGLIEGGNDDGEAPYYPGCVDRVYARQREAAIFELNMNVERLQASPNVMRRFQTGTRLTLHLDERNLKHLNISDIDEMPSSDIIDIFDLPVTTSLEEGWCTRFCDIYGSLFFRQVVDMKFASKLWLDIDADLPVTAKMVERIFSSPSSAGWPEGDNAMDRFYKLRKTVMDLLKIDAVSRTEANAQAAHGKELMWEEMSAEFRGEMGDDEVAAGGKSPERKKKKKKAKKAIPPSDVKADAKADSPFVGLSDSDTGDKGAAQGEAGAAKTDL